MRCSQNWCVVCGHVQGWLDVLELLRRGWSSARIMPVLPMQEAEMEQRKIVSFSATSGGRVKCSPHDPKAGRIPYNVLKEFDGVSYPYGLYSVDSVVE